jgi:hypothetical protein
MAETTEPDPAEVARLADTILEPPSPPYGALAVTTALSLARRVLAAGYRPPEPPPPAWTVHDEAGGSSSLYRGKHFVARLRYGLAEAQDIADRLNRTEPKPEETR